MERSAFAPLDLLRDPYGRIFFPSYEAPAAPEGSPLLQALWAQPGQPLPGGERLVLAQSHWQGELHTLLPEGRELMLDLVLSMVALRDFLKSQGKGIRANLTDRLVRAGTQPKLWPVPADRPALETLCAGTGLPDGPLGQRYRWYRDRLEAGLSIPALGQALEELTVPCLLLDCPAAWQDYARQHLAALPLDRRIRDRLFLRLSWADQEHWLAGWRLLERRTGGDLAGLLAQRLGLAPAPGENDLYPAFLRWADLDHQTVPQVLGRLLDAAR